jgi:8-oxo-dGTP diphosphatase
MRLTIVRHASAGTKRAWPGPDSERPLDAAGERDARELARLLAKHPVGRLISSPAVRCTQTLQPLAELSGRPVETWDGLGTDRGPTTLKTCLLDPGLEHAVLCTHGEAMRPLLRSIDLDHLATSDLPGDRRRLLTKGSAWRLRVTSRGKVVELLHVVPDA